jgi:hypothetical protein
VITTENHREIKVISSEFYFARSYDPKLTIEFQEEDVTTTYEEVIPKKMYQEFISKFNVVLEELEFSKEHGY